MSEQKPLGRERILLFVLLGVVALLILCAICYFAVWPQFQQPLAPTIPAFQTPTSTEESSSTTVTSTPIPVTIATPTQTETGQDTFCGGPEQLVILAAGIDELFDPFPFSADAIRIIRVDFVTPSISVLAIPRDLWVRIPELQTWGISEGRINHSYYYGQEYQVPGGGIALLAQTLSENFGLVVDHYIVMNMDIFTNTVDLVGGVDVFLTQPLEDSKFGYYFPSGWNNLNGEQTLQFIQVYNPDSELDRIDRQTDILADLRDKIIQPSFLPTVPEFALSVIENIITDLSPDQIANLACLANVIGLEEITTITIDPPFVTPTYPAGDNWILIPDEVLIRLLVTNFLNGTLP
ncbi:MAG: LytR family transcriptional regulator [Chloroflexi bacterium]|nr:LytR family transcriptional regulator [Chloroflexota bacterium]